MSPEQREQLKAWRKQHFAACPPQQAAIERFKAGETNDPAPGFIPNADHTALICVACGATWEASDAA